MLINYARVRADALLKDYDTAMKDPKNAATKNTRGLRFANQTDLVADISKFVENSGITGQTESVNGMSANQKKQAVVKAIIAKSREGNNLTKLNIFSRYSRDYFNQYFSMKLGVANTSANSNTLGTVNYQQQLTDYFKTNGIKTYNLNPTNPPA